MESNSTKRRASETEALALIRKNHYSRIPTPLPYLPSDYRPSPDGPRHYIVSQIPSDSTKRQRSHSIGHALAIEGSSQHHFELVPYREWTVIA